MTAQKLKTISCAHCGQPCDDVVSFDNKAFCCQGCKAVFEILQANDLCEYYALDKQSGVTQKNVTAGSFSYLDEIAIRKKVLSFDSAALSSVTFYIPAIHCVSCIWLLDNLRKLNEGILNAQVDFARKTVSIDFDPNATKLSQLAALLSSLGYQPAITLDRLDNPKPQTNRTLLYKLSIAGFSFGNVMLFSFPEYLGINAQDHALTTVFSFLNLALSVPVLLYSASDYFTSSVRSFKQRQVNIDVPIAAGLLALFLRSTYDIISATGPGYLDSFTGLVFFLLIGKWFQSKTYESMSFDRDFKSYFPLAVSRLTDNEWKSTVIYDINPGDTIRIRNMEIVPADAYLTSDSAYFDYGFVTGEAKPVKVTIGELVYAGAKLVGQPIELLVSKKTSQSHLTGLWNKESNKKIDESHYQKIIDRAARKFTIVVLFIAALTACFWYYRQPQEMWLVLTSVLMVACPCALALAAPFTFGSMLRAFGRHNFYLKNADVIERLSTIDAVVFDKTGTITYGAAPDISFNGAMSAEEWSAVKALTATSTHTLSTMITTWIPQQPAANMEAFKEFPGKGIQAVIDGKLIQVGSAAFVGAAITQDLSSTSVFVAIDHDIYGCFSIKTRIRERMKPMIKRLGDRCVALLSGDNSADVIRMSKLFNPSTQLVFDQSPRQKQTFIQILQTKGRRVLMVGDGLNDAGALRQSDVGIAVTENTGLFTPACDGILAADQLTNLDKFIDLSRSASRILKIAFGISFFYNFIALGFAVTGHLSPLVAAILMPVSSISVVSFSTLAVNFIVNKKLQSWQ